MKILLSGDMPHHKANLHAHSTVSDGKWTPAEVKKEYAGRGYSVLALTDHNLYRWHRELDDDTFLCLAGYEANINQAGQEGFNTTGTYHFNFYDKHPWQREEGYAPPEAPNAYGDIAAINHWLAAQEKAGFLACYNHPYWSLQNHSHYIGLAPLFAMEIYNHGCELDGLYGRHAQAYDEMWAQNPTLYPLSADDNHNLYPPGHPLCDAFGGWTMIAAESLTYGAITQALETGSLYASDGPAIHSLVIDEGELVVRCSPVEKIYVKTEGRHCLRAVGKFALLTEARFSLDGVRAFRVDCCDEHGAHAYSRYYRP